MKVSELIKTLQEDLDFHGDIPVKVICCQSPFQDINITYTALAEDKNQLVKSVILVLEHK